MDKLKQSVNPAGGQAVSTEKDFLFGADHSVVLPCHLGMLRSPQYSNLGGGATVKVFFNSLI